MKRNTFLKMWAIVQFNLSMSIFVMQFALFYKRKAGTSASQWESHTAEIMFAAVR